MNLEKMTYEEKTVYFAQAKRITAKEYYTLDKGNNLSYGWFARLRGYNFGEKHATKEAAIKHGKKLRDGYLKEAKEKGLL